MSRYTYIIKNCRPFAILLTKGGQLVNGIKCNSQLVHYFQNPQPNLKIVFFNNFSCGNRFEKIEGALNPTGSR
jgi:hypothetical protein